MTPPKYQTIKHELLGRIKRGEWQVGSQLPSEHELAREYAVSRVTIQRTLRELVVAGVIVRMMGAGTFVARPRARGAFVRLDDLTECESACKGMREVLVRRSRMAGTDSAETGERSLMVYLVIRWWLQGSVASIERWLIRAGRPLDAHDIGSSDTSVVDWLHEQQAIDTVDEEIGIVTLANKSRHALHILDHDPRLSVRRRFYRQDHWVASVRETYATPNLVLRHRYSTLRSGSPANRYANVRRRSDERTAPAPNVARLSY